jgi:hypothetical protein
MKKVQAELEADRGFIRETLADSVATKEIAGLQGNVKLLLPHVLKSDQGRPRRRREVGAVVKSTRRATRASATPRASR